MLAGLQVIVGLIFTSLLPGAEPPAAIRQAQTNNYHGTAVVDNYLWMENMADPSVRAWSDAQNLHTRAYLDGRPARARIQEKLQEYYGKVSPNVAGLEYRGGVLFAMKFQPPAQQPWLVTLKSASETNGERVVLDPNKLNGKGTTAIDWFVPSPDGKLVAISLSENGSEDGTLHFYDVATGRELGDKIPRVQYPTAGGSACWNSDGSGVYYTRFPAPGERPEGDLHFYQQIYFHKLGEAVERDRYELGRDFPRIAEVQLETREDGTLQLATVANGDGGDFAHFLREKSGQWKRLTRFEDQVKHIEFGADDALYLLSKQGAPHGKILRLPLSAGALAETKVFVPEGAEVIEHFQPSAHGLFVQDLVGGPSQIRFFDASGKLKTAVPTKPISAVQQMVWLGDDRLLFRSISFIEPYRWMIYNGGDNSLVATPMVGTSPADFSDVEVIRESAISKDSTKVPLNIIRKKGVKLDGTNPTLLYGYGGYGISLSPSFSFARKIWLDQGGVYVVANIRGGGEFGEDWHKAGNLTRKQNVFDDFAAAAQYLIKSKYTRPEKLALEGGSNGGLLMGAMITQHPDLFRAVISHVGIYDMLRVELDANGEFNITEFGTVKDQAQFKALYDYSPYHHVTDGKRYPAVLFMTGENDGRVNPSNSRKMTARLQAATSSGLPVLLRTSSSSGHGMGTALNERIAQEADGFAFLFDQLGVEYRSTGK